MRKAIIPMARRHPMTAPAITPWFDLCGEELKELLVLGGSVDEWRWPEYVLVAYEIPVGDEVGILAEPGSLVLSYLGVVRAAFEIK
jgi:hypothetical protein